MSAGFENYLLRELLEAYHKARVGGKRKTRNEHEFEMNEMENVLRLRDAIIARKYRPSKGIAFIIRDPVIREIFAAPFIDRVVHHFLFKHAIEWWEPRLWRGSYACLKGRGTLYGVFDLQKNMRRVSQDGRVPIVVVKRDLQGYFMSLERDKLYRRVMWGLKRQFPDGGELYRTLKYLWKEVIYDVPIDGVRLRGRKSDWMELPLSKSLFYQVDGRGIVIGNLTSQLLSNIFLDQLDRFIVYELGYRHYGRYVDDFYIVMEEEKLEEYLVVMEPMIERKLGELGLVMHPKKRVEILARDGVEFLGAKVYCDRIIPGERMARNFMIKVYEFETRGKGKLEGLGAYDGLMSHYDSEKLIRKAYGVVGWKYRNCENRDF